MTEVGRDGNAPKVQIWHNPRCSKSRATLALLEERLDAGEIGIVRYLEHPPSREQLSAVLTALGRTAGEFVRRSESRFRELELVDADDDTLIEAMVENPQLIERPVVLHAGTARVGRPPESVLEIL